MRLLAIILTIGMGAPSSQTATADLQNELHQLLALYKQKQQWLEGKGGANGKNLQLKIQQQEKKFIDVLSQANSTKRRAFFQALDHSIQKTILSMLERHYAPYKPIFELYSVLAQEEAIAVETKRLKSYLLVLILTGSMISLFIAYALYQLKKIKKDFQNLSHWLDNRG